MEEKRCAGGVLDEAAVGRVMEEDDDVILPGFRFHPTDEELVGFYLRRKAEGKPLSVEIIKQVDIYKYDPWDLPRVSNIGDKEWYFFCLRGRKYRNSIRPNRVTGSGFWKATGIDRPIYGAHKGDCVGLKKSLVYYRGSAGKGAKTDWMMHEFRLPPGGGGGGGGKVIGVSSRGLQEGETWTVCRIFKRTVTYKKRAQSWRSGAAAAAAAEQEPTGLSSTVCSAESNGEANYKQQQPESSLQRSDDNSTITWYEDQLWSSPPAQALSPASTAKDLPFGDDGCWDELAGVVELSADPFFIYDYTDSTYDAGSFLF